MTVFLCLEIGYFHPAWYFQLKNKRAISFVQDLEEGGNWTDRQIRIWLHEAAGPIVWSAQKTALKLENQKRSEQAGQILAVLRDFIWVGLLWRTLAFAKEAESWHSEETGGLVGQNSQHSLLTEFLSKQLRYFSLNLNMPLFWKYNFMCYPYL